MPGAGVLGNNDGLWVREDLFIKKWASKTQGQNKPH